MLVDGYHVIRSYPVAADGLLEQAVGHEEIAREAVTDGLLD